MIAQFQRREALSAMPAPVLSDIACLPHILHDLQAMLTQEVEVELPAGDSKSDDGNSGTTEIQVIAVFPALPSPPARKETAAGRQIKSVLGSLADVLSGLSGVVSNVDFSDVELAESVDADSAGAALAIGALIALPDGQLAAVEVGSDSDSIGDDAANGDADDDASESEAAPATVPLGRVGNRSLRKAHRSLRALEAEQTADAIALIAQEESAARERTARSLAAAASAAAPAAASAVDASAAGKKRVRGPDKAPRQRSRGAKGGASSSRRLSTENRGEGEGGGGGRGGRGSLSSFKLSCGRNSAQPSGHVPFRQWEGKLNK